MIAKALQAKQIHAHALLRKPGVVAVGVGVTVFNRFRNVADLLDVSI